MMSAANEHKAGGSKPSVQLAREPAQGVWSGVMSVDFASSWFLRSSRKVLQTAAGHVRRGILHLKKKKIN